MGSSPRWRGKRCVPCSSSDLSRLIPALAGKTASGSERRSQSRAHPRAGGENRLLSVKRPLAVGSSPRWRGKRTGLLRPSRSGRLIPALAGKTSECTESGRGPQAHPRAGGENDLTRDEITLRGGSSPRWRGKPLIPILPTLGNRLIPALAGKTPTIGIRREARRAHPRAGGENEAPRARRRI